MKLGEIWLVNFPFTDGSGTKLRPVLVVSANRFSVGGDVVVIPISSQVFAGDPFVYQLDSTMPAFRLTGLKTASSVKWTKPVTLAGSIFQRRLGFLSGRPLDDIRGSLRSVFSQSLLLIDAPGDHRRSAFDAANEPLRYSAIKAGREASAVMFATQRRHQTPASATFRQGQ